MNTKETGEQNKIPPMSELSILDYFAGQAMQSWLVGVEDPKIERCASQAYEIAQAMLKEREKHL